MYRKNLGNSERGSFYRTKTIDKIIEKTQGVPRFITSANVKETQCFN